MLRNSFLNRYEKKTSKYFLNDKILRQEDEDYLIYNNRPLAPKAISKLSKQHLLGFVDDVLTNKKVSFVLYSSNSTSEIKHYLHSNEVMEKNSLSPNKFNRISKSKASTASRMKEYRNQYNKIREHIRNYKKDKVTHVSLLIKKNECFFDSLKKQHKATKSEGTYERINSLRLKNYNRSLQRCRSQIAKNPFFELPDVKLDVNNVYSRLYHNEVLINRARVKSKNESKKIKKAHKGIVSRSYTSDNNTTWSITNGNAIGYSKSNSNSNGKEQVPILFNLKHVIKHSNGKEFTMKVTDRVFNKCFHKHSSGPISNMIKFYSKNKLKEGEDNDNEKLISLTRIKDEKGNSYLHDAVLNSSYEFVKYYLGKKLSPNAQNSSGNTPLHLAMKVRIPEIINLLLDNKADLTIENLKKETPYDLAPIDIKKRLKLDKKLVDKINYPNSLLII